MSFKKVVLWPIHLALWLIVLVLALVGVVFSLVGSALIGIYKVKPPRWAVRYKEWLDK